MVIKMKINNYIIINKINQKIIVYEKGCGCIGGTISQGQVQLQKYLLYFPQATKLKNAPYPTPN